VGNDVDVVFVVVCLCDFDELFVCLVSSDV